MQVSPLTLNSRIYSMDVIRGIAVLGILLMNIPGFAGNEFLISWWDVLAHKLTLNGFLFKSVDVAFSGKMRGLFTVLFGAGLMLFIENKKSDNIQVADAYFRRMMWMLVFGLVHAYLLLWTGDVLYEYALCGMFLFAFRNLRVRYMLMVAAICIGIYTWQGAKNFTLWKNKSTEYLRTGQVISAGKPLTEEQKKLREEFENFLGHHYPFSKVMTEEIKADVRDNYILYHSDYMSIISSQAPEIFAMHTEGFYTTFWESFAVILIGMALFKLGFFQYRLSLRSYRLWCFVGIPLGLAVNYICHKLWYKTQVELWYTYSWRSLSSLWVENPVRIVLIIAYASALMLLCRLTWLRGFLNLFANTGRMAFTNYILQSVLCGIYFYGYGLGHYGEYYAAELLVFVLCVWMLLILFSTIWLRYFKMGPLESLWRYLTYGRERLPSGQIQNS